MTEDRLTEALAETLAETLAEGSSETWPEPSPAPVLLEGSVKASLPTAPGQPSLDELWDVPPPTLVGGDPVDIPRETQAARLHGVLEPGTQFGVYVVGACIGEGGMARIYQAEHAGLRRQVALKVLTNGFAKDPDGRERFVREARIAAAIKHPNVVNIFDVGVHEDIPYLVMELLEGVDLEALLESRGTLDEATIVDIMVPVVAGLSAVHDAGVVHRDLKPGNIFLARGRYDEFEPKLLDFGISKAQGPEQLKLTTGGQMMGTPFYVAPEGLRGEGMTTLSDQYSLGVVMYECATGHTPFNAETLPELIRLITLGAHTPSNTQNPKTTRRLSRIISRAMSLVPEQRYKDVREMGRELLLLAGQRTRVTWGLSFGELSTASAVGTGDGGHDTQSVAPAPLAGPRRKYRLAALLPLLVFVLLIVLARSGQRSEEGAESASPSVHALKPAAAKGSPAVDAPLPPVLTPSEAEPPGAARDIVRVRSERTAPASRRPLVNAPSNELDWLSPRRSTTLTTKSADHKAPAGANGAPIFD